jgi:hypothetical protein
MNPAHLPWLLTLYDALTDDDVDVREAAAEAAIPILGLSLIPIEAGARLLRWLAVCFGHEPNFLTHIAGRMVGHNFSSTSFSITRITERGTAETDGLDWVSAEIQLEDAMRFDDSLFVIEEHNQYIDEVREARRWTDVFLSLASVRSKDARVNANKALAKWTIAGLHTITRIAQSESTATGDGPLGWASKPQVFAICARVLICASALVKLQNAQSHIQSQRGEAKEEIEEKLYVGVTEELRRFWELGRGDQARVHGLLLRMCGIED